MGADGPLFLKWRYLPRLFPWLVPFLRTGDEESVSRTAAALSDLLFDAVVQHRAIAQGTAVEQYIATGECTFLYRDRAAYLAEALDFDIRRGHGFTWDELDRAALRKRDPALGPVAGYGATTPDHGWITDPSAYVAALFDACRSLGAEFVRAEVNAIHPDGEGAVVICQGEDGNFDHAVIASGAWSRKLAESLGHHSPLETERGYHIMLENPGICPPYTNGG